MDELKTEIIVEGPTPMDKTKTTTIKPSAKPGVKTSEFWGSMAVHAVAMLIIAYGMWKGSDGLMEFGGILMGLSQGTYNIGRGLTKKDEPK